MKEGSPKKNTLKKMIVPSILAVALLAAGAFSCRALLQLQDYLDNQQGTPALIEKSGASPLAAPVVR